MNSLQIYQFREFHSVLIPTSKDRVDAAIRTVTPPEIQFYQTLTWIRRFGRPSPPGVLNPPRDRPILETLTHGVLLADNPGQETLCVHRARLVQNLFGPAEGRFVYTTQSSLNNGRGALWSGSLFCAKERSSPSHKLAAKYAAENLTGESIAKAAGPLLPVRPQTPHVCRCCSKAWGPGRNNGREIGIDGQTSTVRIE